MVKIALFFFFGNFFLFFCCWNKSDRLPFPLFVVVLLFVVLVDATLKCSIYGWTDVWKSASERPNPECLLMVCMKKKRGGGSYLSSSQSVVPGTFTLDIILGADVFSLSVFIRHTFPWDSPDDAIFLSAGSV